MAAHVLNPNIQNTNLVFPYMATAAFHPVIGMLILIAGMSATISSGDSDAMTGVTILVNDVYSLITGKAVKAKNIVGWSKIMACLVIGVVLLFIWFATDILGYIQTMISTLLAGVAIAGIFGRFWKRATWQGAIAAIIMASATSFYITGNKKLLAFWGGPIMPSLVVSALSLILVSLMTPASMRTKEQVLDEIISQRKDMGF